MKYHSEKEKKLVISLEKLKNLEFKDFQTSHNIDELNNQKNQLKIEKQDIEIKYQNLLRDNENKKNKLITLNQKVSKEKIKDQEFADKIDELNQETDMLMEEMDKWQT